MKKNQIIIIAVSSVLVLVCVTLAILYFATDTFKSNKDLFFKYVKQINLEEITGAQEYPNYLKRLSNESHNDEGMIKIEIGNESQSINETIEYLRICRHIK